MTFAFPCPEFAHEADPMTYDRDKHHRRSIRLPDYDYACAGAYFVTICTQGRECVLAEPVVHGITVGVWRTLPQWFPTITPDAFVVMPNHVHFIVWLGSPPDRDAGRIGSVGAPLAGARGVLDRERLRATASVAPTNASLPGSSDNELGDWIIPFPRVTMECPALADVVGAFKSLVVRTYREWAARHDPERCAAFWQRNYYERIIRNGRELRALRSYIRANPLNWARDVENPDRE